MKTNDDDQARIAAANQRYRAAAPGVQTGIAMEMESGDATETTPKHLRVGVDLRAVDHQALAELLIEKGLITQVEYHERLADCAERERAARERRLSARLHSTITLR